MFRGAKGPDVLIPGKTATLKAAAALHLSDWFNGDSSINEAAGRLCRCNTSILRCLIGMQEAKEVQACLRRCKHACAGASMLVQVQAHALVYGPVGPVMPVPPVGPVSPAVPHTDNNFIKTFTKRHTILSCPAVLCLL